MHRNGVLLLAAGGIAYTIGAGFYLQHFGTRITQTTTYVCALLGTAFHYFAVYFYVQPSECSDTDLVPEVWLAPLQKLFG